MSSGECSSHARMPHGSSSDVGHLIAGEAEVGPRSAYFVACVLEGAG